MKRNLEKILSKIFLGLMLSPVFLNSSYLIRANEQKKQVLTITNPSFVLNSEQYKIIKKAISHSNAPKVFSLFSIREPFIIAETYGFGGRKIGQKDGYLNMRVDYLCGERGGSGKLEFIFYLDENHLEDPSGIECIELIPFSSERTRISKKVFELNINQNLGCVTYQDVEERLIESDLFFEKIERLPNLIAKVLKLSPKEIDEIEFLLESIRQSLNYEQKQIDVQDGNILVGDHVYCNIIRYYGYGELLDGKLLDINLYSMTYEKKVPRAPKIVRISIEEGEESIKGLKVRATKRNYWTWYIEGLELGAIREKCFAEFIVPFNVKELISEYKDKE